MKSVLAKWLDSITILAVGFVLLFAWVRFYSKDAVLSAVVAAGLSGVICFCINRFCDKRERKMLGSKTDKKNAEMLGLNLLGSTNDEILDFFAKALADTDKTVEKCKNCLKMEYYSAQNSMHSTAHSTSIFPIFHKMQVEQNDLILVLKIARDMGANCIQIYGIDISADAKTFASKIKNMDIQFFDQYHLYSISKHVHPPVSLNTESIRLTFGDYLKFALDKARARNYLLFGLILLASSFLVPYKIYYLVSGSILCITALAVRLYPHKKER